MLKREGDSCPVPIVVPCDSGVGASPARMGSAPAPGAALDAPSRASGASPVVYLPPRRGSAFSQPLQADEYPSYFDPPRGGGRGASARHCTRGGHAPLFEL